MAEEVVEAIKNGRIVHPSCQKGIDPYCGVLATDSALGTPSDVFTVWSRVGSDGKALDDTHAERL